MARKMHGNAIIKKFQKFSKFITRTFSATVTPASQKASHESVLVQKPLYLANLTFNGIPIVLDVDEPLLLRGLQLWIDLRVSQSGAA
jgi:hypothetical protein